MPKTNLLPFKSTTSGRSSRQEAWELWSPLKAGASAMTILNKYRKEKAMLTLNYALMRNTTFRQGMDKLLKHEGFRPKLAIHIAKINQGCRDESKIIQEQYEKMVRKYAKQDADGKLLPPEGMPGGFEISEENEKEWAKDLAEFNATEFSVDQKRISASLIGETKLTPLELEALEDVIDFDK